MHTEGGEQSFENVRTPGVSHEHRDASFRAVMSFAIGLAITAAIIQLVIWAMLHKFDQMRAASEVQTHSEFGMNAPAPAPRLQTDPALDLNKFRASEERILNEYTWADDQHTAVRIPIDKAKEELLSRGLPVVQGGGAPATVASRPSNAPQPPQSANR